MAIRLTTEQIQYIGLFETITRAGVRDCIIDGDKIIFVVNEGEMGKAIGKNGVNIKNLEKILNKKIEIVQYSDDPIQFLLYFFRPAEFKEAYVAERNDGKKIIKLSFNSKSSASKSKVNKAKMFVKKYYNIDDIQLN